MTTKCDSRKKMRKQYHLNKLIICNNNRIIGKSYVAFVDEQRLILENNKLERMNVKLKFRLRPSFARIMIFSLSTIIVLWLSYECFSKTR